MLEVTSERADSWQILEKLDDDDDAASDADDEKKSSYHSAPQT